MVTAQENSIYTSQNQLSHLVLLSQKEGMEIATIFLWLPADIAEFVYKPTTFLT